MKTWEIVKDEKFGYENIAFSEKPSEEMRTAMKNAGWAFSKNFGRWYPRTANAKSNASNFVKGFEKSFGNSNEIVSEEKQIESPSAGLEQNEQSAVSSNDVSVIEGDSNFLTADADNEKRQIFIDMEKKLDDFILRKEQETYSGNINSLKEIEEVINNTIVFTDKTLDYYNKTFSDFALSHNLPISWGKNIYTPQDGLQIKEKLLERMKAYRNVKDSLEQDPDKIYVKDFIGNFDIDRLLDISRITIEENNLEGDDYERNGNSITAGRAGTGKETGSISSSEVEERRGLHGTGTDYSRGRFNSEQTLNEGYDESNTGRNPDVIRREEYQGTSTERGQLSNIEQINDSERNVSNGRENLSEGELGSQSVSYPGSISESGNELETEEQIQTGAPSEGRLPWDPNAFNEALPDSLKLRKTWREKENLYWVSQRHFNDEDLEEFQKELMKYDGIERAYVTTSDFTRESAEEDMENRIFAVVDKDFIDSSDYQAYREAEEKVNTLGKIKAEINGTGHFVNRGNDFVRYNLQASLKDGLLNVSLTKSEKEDLGEKHEKVIFSMEETGNVMQPLNTHEDITGDEHDRRVQELAREYADILFELDDDRRRFFRKDLGVNTVLPESQNPQEEINKETDDIDIEKPAPDAEMLEQATPEQIREFCLKETQVDLRKKQTEDIFNFYNNNEKYGLYADPDGKLYVHNDKTGETSPADGKILVKGTTFRTIYNKKKQNSTIKLSINDKNFEEEKEQWALTEEGISELLSRSFASSFETMDSNPELWLCFLDKGVDPRGAILNAAADAYLGDNLNWLLDNVPAEKLQEIFSDKEYADKVYKAAKDSLENDPDNPPTEAFNRLEKLCGKDISHDEQSKVTATNFVLDKLKAAGIEVVTDKKEFDRILAEGTRLQKMTGDFAELENLFQNAQKQEGDIKALNEKNAELEKKDNLNKVQEETQNKSGFRTLSLVSSESENIESLFVSKNEANLNSEIDSVSEKDINLKDEFITISEKTPFILKEFGLDEFPVNMYRQKLARALFLEKEEFGERRTHGHKGEFTGKQVKEVFKDIGNPRYIFNSKKDMDNSDNFYLIGVYDEMDENGNPMMISFHCDKNKNQVEANWITSVYGKEKNTLVNDWSKKGFLLYKNDIDIEKAPAEVVTLYMRVSTSASAYESSIKLKSDYVNKMNLLFAKEKGIVYGFTDGEKIYLDPEVINSNVAVHEYTHLWDEYTRRTNPELWQKGIELFKDDPIWDEVKHDPSYTDIRDDDNLILSEIHACLTGDMAQKVLERIAREEGEIKKDKVIDWDREIDEYLVSEFGKLPEGKRSKEREEKLDIVREFMSETMKDLMSGRNLSLSQKQTEEKSQSTAPVQLSADEIAYELEVMESNVRDRNGWMSSDEITTSKENSRKYLEEIKSRIPAGANYGEKVLLRLENDNYHTLNYGLAVLGAYGKDYQQEALRDIEKYTENGLLLPPDVANEFAGKYPAEEITEITGNETTHLTKSEIKKIREQSREILKKADSEITEEDKKILAQYEGGGGINESNRSTSAVLNEFYTPQNLVDKVWSLVDYYAPEAKTVMEPSGGIGKFAVNRPDNEFTIHELDETSARIAKILHPEADVIQGAYQKQFFDEGGRARKTDFVQPKYDVVIGNPPYGKYNDVYRGLGEGKEFDRYEEYFIAKGLEALKDENSVLAFVVPSGFLKSSNDYQKKFIADRGQLIDAFRLPEGTFGTTDVGTDIIVMKNWEQYKGREALEQLKAAEAEKLSEDSWFNNHPEKVLGETVSYTDRFGKEAEKVVPREGRTVQNELDEIDTYVKNLQEVRKSQSAEQSKLTLAPATPEKIKENLPEEFKYRAQEIYDFYNENENLSLHYDKDGKLWVHNDKKREVSPADIDDLVIGSEIRTDYSERTKFKYIQAAINDDDEDFEKQKEMLAATEEKLNYLLSNAFADSFDTVYSDSKREPERWKKIWQGFIDKEVDPREAILEAAHLKHWKQDKTLYTPENLGWLLDNVPAEKLQEIFSDKKYADKVYRIAESCLDYNDDTPAVLDRLAKLCGKTPEHEQGISSSEEKAETKVTAEFNYFVKDPAEFEEDAEFEPVTGLSAEEAVAKYLELQNSGVNCGIGINIPGDYVFDDKDGMGNIILGKKNGEDSINLAVGGELIKNLKAGEHADIVIAAVDELVSAAGRNNIEVKGVEVLNNKKNLFSKWKKEEEQQSNAEKTATNFVLDKLKAAGIEVVTDKKEFDRILKSAERLQAMKEHWDAFQTEGLSEGEIKRREAKTEKSLNEFLDYVGKTARKEIPVEEYVNIYTDPAEIENKILFGYDSDGKEDAWIAHLKTEKHPEGELVGIYRWVSEPGSKVCISSIDEGIFQEEVKNFYTDVWKFEQSNPLKNYKDNLEKFRNRAQIIFADYPDDYHKDLRMEVHSAILDWFDERLEDKVAVDDVTPFAFRAAGAPNFPVNIEKWYIAEAMLAQNEELTLKEAELQTVLKSLKNPDYIFKPDDESRPYQGDVFCGVYGDVAVDIKFDTADNEAKIQWIRKVDDEYVQRNIDAENLLYASDKYFINPGEYFNRDGSPTKEAKRILGIRDDFVKEKVQDFVDYVRESYKELPGEKSDFDIHSRPDWIKNKVCVGYDDYDREDAWIVRRTIPGDSITGKDEGLVLVTYDRNSAGDITIFNLENDEDVRKLKDYVDQYADPWNFGDDYPQEWYQERLEEIEEERQEQAEEKRTVERALQLAARSTESSISLPGVENIEVVSKDNINNVPEKTLPSDFAALDKSLRFNANFEIESRKLGENVSIFPGSIGKSGIGIRHIIEECHKNNKFNQNEITALAGLILDTVRTGEFTLPSASRTEFSKNGIKATVRRMYFGEDENHLVLTGFDFDGKDIDGNINRDAINTVIDSYGSSDSFSYLRSQVGNVMASIDSNVAQTISKPNIQKMSTNNGRTYGIAYNGKIYLDPEVMNSNVAVHEYTHLWDAYTQRTNPELWQKGMDLLKDTELWNEIKADPGYADISNDDNRLLSEVHARITGYIAQQVLERIAREEGEIKKDRVIDWDKEVSQYLMKEFDNDRINKLSKEGKEKAEVLREFMSSSMIRDFMAAPVKDLMNGKDISLSQEQAEEKSQSAAPAQEKEQTVKPEAETTEKKVEAEEVKESENLEIEDDNASMREYSDPDGLFKTRKILSVEEFSKFYTGNNFNEIERNIWVNTDYKGNISLNKLSAEEISFIKESPNYIEIEKDNFQNTLLYCSGNIYEKLQELEYKKNSIPLENYEKCKNFLESVKPEPVEIKDIKMDILSPLASEFEVFGSVDPDDGGTMNLVRDFLSWAHGRDEDAYLTSGYINYNTANISREDIPEGIYWSDVVDYIRRVPVKTNILKNDTKEIKEQKEITAGSKQDLRKETAYKLFNRYLQTGLSEENKERFAAYWNRIYNGKVDVDYKKLPLFISGMSTFKGKDPFILYKQQVEGISRLVSKGNGLLAYDVGVGKTAAGIVATAAQLQSGRSKRPLIIVPNQVYEKWTTDFEQLFPDMKINRLGNLSDDYLRSFAYSRLNHTIDIPENSVSIMTASALQKITFSDEAIGELAEEFGSVMGISEQFEDSNPRTRALAIAKVNEVIGKASAIQERTVKGKSTVKENQYVFFDKLGFDNICIDEAHNYKNLYTVPTPRSKSKTGKKEAAEFKGIGNGGQTSKRALKAFGICSLVQKHNDNRNVFLLTATPFTNNPLEVYSMLSLMGRKELKDRHIYDIRDFCTEFAKTKFEYAVTPSGEIKPKTVMKAFNGKVKLRSLINEFIDKVSAEEAGIPRPKGERHKVLLEMTPVQKEIMKAAEDRITGKNKKVAGQITGVSIPKNSGEILKAMTNMRTCTLSPALLNPDDFPDIELPPITELVESSPKLQFVCDTVADVWKEKPECGQFIYMPQGVDYCNIVKDYLVKKGIPEDCIEYVTGKHKSSPEDKQEVAAKFNDKDNKLKILIGGSNLAEGIDLNGNSIACYNTMLGWNPTETVQVEGRIWRQGNKQGKVHIFYPLIEDSIDAVMYQKYDEKSSRINDVFSDNDLDKDTIDVSEINPEELKFELIKDPEKKIDMLIDQETAVQRKEISVLKIQKESLMEYQKSFNEHQKEIKIIKEDIEKHKIKLERGEDFDITKNWIERDRKILEKKTKLYKTLQTKFMNMDIKDIENPNPEINITIERITAKIDSIQDSLTTVFESKEERIQQERIKLAEKKLLAKPVEATRKAVVNNILTDTWYAETKQKQASEKPVSNIKKTESAVTNNVETSKAEAVKITDFNGNLFDMFEATPIVKLDKTNCKKFGNNMLTKDALYSYQGIPPFIVNNNNEIIMRVKGKDLVSPEAFGFNGNVPITSNSIVDIKVSVDDMRNFTKRYITERKADEFIKTTADSSYKKKSIVISKAPDKDRLKNLIDDYKVNAADFAKIAAIHKDILFGGNEPIMKNKTEKELVNKKPAAMKEIKKSVSRVDEQEAERA